MSPKSKSTNLATIQTPGVYIQELNAFPNSVTGVATAVPAFIGYTPKASYLGKSYTKIPVKISSFAEFTTYFCLPDPQQPTNQTKQYSPQYYLVQQKSQPVKGDYILNNGSYYSIVPDPSTIYYLYNSVKLFYENGGGDAYIVSVGPYGPASQKPMAPDAPLVNANVQLNDLQKGLYALLNAQEPTMYICPEATLLNLEDNGTLMQDMLNQASTLMTSVCIFDIIGGNAPDPVLYKQDIANFRAHTGMNGLSYGIAYYPFIGTNLMQNTAIDYTNLFGGDFKQLESIINPSSAPNPDITAILNNIRNPESGLTIAQNNNALMNASSLYSLIINHVLANANILPPSGGMAGVITATDTNTGPWQAPANTSIAGVISLPIALSDSQQGPLNVDAVSGKSINVIRSFNSLGILVWGARTLDGNSPDFKYISVRRTLVYLEQSCKFAIQPFIFAPNDQNTWVAATSMISDFLTSVWKQGGLQGASPKDAFQVICGLGQTMNGEDILNGYMIVLIKVALIRPDEFITLTVQQQMKHLANKET
ncbi:phage tail sheath family protein [Flavobacterium sp.]|uniref:phage tail sheath family protein n=1 Tax=Flavobacterium sp. TaxID=239 RepID=UPI003D119E1F